MRVTVLALVASSFALLGCGSPTTNTATNTETASETVRVAPTSQQQFAVAQAAVDLCARQAPNWTATVAAFKSAGYSEAGSWSRQGNKTVTLEAPNADVLVLVGSQGGDGTCIVGLEGMTSEQSVRLAQPWVKTFDASPFGQADPSRKAAVVQTWRGETASHYVRISAYRSWDLLDAPGGSARLLFIRK